MSLYLNKATLFYRSSNNKLSYAQLIPSLEELTECLKTESLNDITQILCSIAVDYVELYLEDYLNIEFRQKHVALAFFIREKGLSCRLVQKNIITKRLYPKEQMNTAIKEAYATGSINKTALKYYINHHSLRNSIRKLNEYEKLNSFVAPDNTTPHNQTIEQIGNMSIQKGYQVYSEHVSTFSMNIGENFKNIDLVGLKDNDIKFVIEVEITHNIKNQLII